MKGDFSRWEFDPLANFSGVLYQQGRVRTDVDDNAATQIEDHWRKTVARDVIGAGAAAVPADANDGFKVTAASLAGGVVTVTLTPGRVWADGVHFYLAGSAPIDVKPSYLAPPLQSPQATAASIDADVRDVVVLDVWEESVSGFQEPLSLIEPALGGPDTTERVRVSAAVALMRIGPNDDCAAVSGADDDFTKKGKLTVTPAPAIVIAGDCPVEAGGGYTGFEHYLFRIEIAEPEGGQARLKWSQFNGGLVGRGTFKAGGTPATGTVTITANDQMTNHCGLASFYLEALDRDPVFGAWRVVASANAALQDGALALTEMQGAWPATPTGFFRLWNGIRPIADFPTGADPAELQDGIHIALDAPAAGNLNYTPGDYWTFPVRASGTPFDPALLPSKAPPQGVHHHRVALAEITWDGSGTATGTIDDCRRVFLPLTKQKGCCTYTVGDGVGSHGDFDSIEEALRQLPVSGGEICLLPGLHQTNAVISGRHNVRIHGCHHNTKLVPRKGAATDPIFRIVDSLGVVLERMDMVTLGGTAILVEGSKPGGVADVEIADNRILACQNAIRVTNGAEIAIHHNRIRMLDKRDSGVAIYLAADDSVIERNDIRLVPAPVMPPLNVPGDPTPIDPNDPCARLEVVYVNPRIFVKYVDQVWRLPLLLVPILTQPYRALGGIQIGGGSERVRVLENVVIGGASNGITLGDGIEMPPERAPLTITVPIEARILGLVAGPGGKPVAAQVTLTPQPSGQARNIAADQRGTFVAGLNAGKYAIDATAPGLELGKAELVRRDDRVFQLNIAMTAAAAPRDPRTSGFLYQIAIVGNSISAMGLSGIGMPPLGSALAGGIGRLAAAASTRVRFGNPVVGLEIRQNRIVGCLKNPFDSALRAQALVHGLGGISLGLCEDVAIVENRIEGNGNGAVGPTCGIFVAYGEGVDITANRILGNGPLPTNITNLQLLPGFRGGIVLGFVSSFNALAGVNAAGTTNVAPTALTNPRPAARVHQNVVDQPAGLALYAAAYGPLSITDNSFNSELSGVNPLELAAGTVLIVNIGGMQQAPAAVRLQSQTAGLAGTPSGAASLKSAVFARTPTALALLPNGNTLFNDNQSRTGAANTSATCQVINSLSDVSYQGNQSRSERAGNLFSNVFLGGTTLRAVGNRLSEAETQTLMSLFTLSARLNNTSLNQGDHCIVAADLDPATPNVVVANQVLNPSAVCADLQKLATAKFKP
jgi:hypothetical protein